MEKFRRNGKKIKNISRIEAITDQDGLSGTQYYMDVKNGKRTLAFLHNDLEPILRDSNGVFVYQEEVMRFLVEIVGYSWEESDMIRSAIAKKKHEVIMATFDRIRTSCRARGWSEEAIETICQQIMAFSRYSFNKSHSYAYGELGYITLWLKNHYKLEWWSSVLNNEDKEDKTRRYISYLGKIVAPPSLRNPSSMFVIRGDKIVAPISVVKGIGPTVVSEIVSKGPFLDLKDYVDRINHSKVNIGGMTALIKARAADDLMDSSDISYNENRRKFMNDYCSLRKSKTQSKTQFKEDMFDFNPIKLFLDERETNQCFNKSLLSDITILSLIQSKWPGLQETGRKGIPLMMGKNENSRVPVLASVKVAEGIINNKRTVDTDGEVIMFGMILLFEGSELRSGISKKTGKDWSCLSIKLSDGFNTIEATDWKRNKALRLPKNSILYVKGELKRGWKTSAAINIVEIEEVK